MERDHGYEEYRSGRESYGITSHGYENDFDWMIKRSDFFTADLSEIEMVLITKNLCSAFLDMRCISEGEKIEIYYDTAGYVLLSEYIENRKCTPSEVLKICISFLNAAVICEEYMLSLREISFRESDVYYSAEKSEIRIRYIPGYENRTGIREKLVHIVDSSIKYRDDYSGFIEPLSIYKRKLYYGDHDIQELLELTEECIRSADRYIYSVSENGNEKQVNDVEVQEKKRMSAVDNTFTETIRHQIMRKFSDLLS